MIFVPIGSARAITRVFPGREVLAEHLLPTGCWAVLVTDFVQLNSRSLRQAFRAEGMCEIGGNGICARRWQHDLAHDPSEMASTVTEFVQEAANSSPTLLQAYVRGRPAEDASSDGDVRGRGFCAGCFEHALFTMLRTTRVTVFVSFALQRWDRFRRSTKSVAFAAVGRGGANRTTCPVSNCPLRNVGVVKADPRPSNSRFLLAISLRHLHKNEALTRTAI